MEAVISKKQNNILVYVALLLSSFFLILLNTAMSPLYIESYITHDASIFYVIGRAMKEGMVPYKDLFDHKGLYIYFIYYLAALVGEKNSIGLFIIFSLLAFIYSIFTFKIINFYKDKLVSFLSSLFLLILSTSMYFCHNSILCEYLSLIIVTISIYIMCLYFNVDLAKDSKTGFKPVYMLINGVLCGMNIMSKANYSLYFGAVAIYVFIDLVFIKKDFILFIKNIIFGIVGLIIGLLPAIVYCLITNSLKDMIFAVFTFNFNYVSGLSIDLPKEVDTTFKALLYTLKSYFNMIFLSISSIVILIYKKFPKNQILFFILSFVFLLFSVLMALTGYTHYLTLLLPCIIPFVVVVVHGIVNLSNVNISKNKLFQTVALGLVLVFSFFVSNIIGRDVLIMNFSYMASDTMKVKRTLSKYIKINKNTKVLCVGGGQFYHNYLGDIPRDKYFYIPSIPANIWEEPIEEVHKYVTKKSYDVICYVPNSLIVNKYNDEMKKYLDENYVLISNKSGKAGQIYLNKNLYKE